jgi:hypothetical protein
MVIIHPKETNVVLIHCTAQQMKLPKQVALSSRSMKQLRQTAQIMRVGTGIPSLADRLQFPKHQQSPIRTITAG